MKLVRIHKPPGTHWKIADINGQYIARSYSSWVLQNATVLIDEERRQRSLHNRVRSVHAWVMGRLLVETYQPDTSLFRNREQHEIRYDAERGYFFIPDREENPFLYALYLAGTPDGIMLAYEPIVTIGN